MNFYEFKNPMFPVYGVVGAKDVRAAHRAYQSDISGKRSYAIPQEISAESARVKYLSAVDPMGTHKCKKEVEMEFNDLKNNYPVFLVVADQFI